MGIESEESFTNIQKKINKYFNSNKVKYTKIDNIKFYRYTWTVAYEIIIELINQPKNIKSSKIFSILSQYNSLDFTTRYASCLHNEFKKEDLSNFIKF